MSFSSPAKTDGDPLGKREIRRHDRGAALVAVGDQIEEQLAADAIEGHEAQLVDDEDVDAQEPLLQPRELAGVARFEQLPDQIGGAREEHAPFLFRRFDAERDREVGLAGADRAGEDQILRRRDPLAARQRVNLRRADALDRREIKRVEGLHLGKARLAQPLADDGLMARGQLRAEDLVQIVFVRPVRVAGLPRRALKTRATPGA